MKQTVHRDGVSTAGLECAAVESSSSRMRSTFRLRNFPMSLAKVLLS